MSKKKTTKEQLENLNKKQEQMKSEYEKQTAEAIKIRKTYEVKLEELKDDRLNLKEEIMQEAESMIRCQKRFNYQI